MTGESQNEKGYRADSPVASRFRPDGMNSLLATPTHGTGTQARTVYRESGLVY
jgi:hypothetical protein